MHFIKLNATTLHFKKTNGASAAPALVLVNSLGTDFRIWDEFLAHLGHQGEILPMINADMAFLMLGTRPIPLICICATSLR